LSSIKILLINPWIVDFKAYDERMRPLALYRFLERAPKNAEIRLIDCLDARAKLKLHNTADFESVEIEKPGCFQEIPRRYKRYGISLTRFREQAKAFGKPDIVGITTLMTYWYPGVRLATALLREMFGDIPIVAGGVYASLMPAHLSGLPEGIRPYASGDFAGFGGLSRPLSAAESRNVLPVRLRTGCPFHCTYCAASALDDSNSADPDWEKARLDHFVFTGGRDIVFYDDAFLHDFHSIAGPYLEYIVRKDYPVRLHFPNGLHARFLDAQAARLLVDAGAKSVRLGYERHRAEPKADESDLIRAVASLTGAGMAARDIGGYLLLGLGDVEETEAGVDFLHSLGIRVFLNQFSPVPGSDLFTVWANRYPELMTEPLLHNDTSFVFTHGGLEWERVQAVKNRTKAANAKLRR
jgi:hypothetical protein